MRVATLEGLSGAPGSGRVRVPAGAVYPLKPCYWLCSDVKLLPEEFRALGARDKRLQNLRVILLIPRCSVSAVSNPVAFLLQENGGMMMMV